MAVTFDITITSVDEGTTWEYDQEDEEISFLEISNTKTDNYSKGRLSMINLPTAITIGMKIEISVNGTDLFVGFISDIAITSIGKRETTLNLTGVTSLLWKDVVDEGIIE